MKRVKKRDSMYQKVRDDDCVTIYMTKDSGKTTIYNKKTYGITYLDSNIWSIHGKKQKEY